MSTAQEIIDAIDKLSLEEKAEFYKKLYGWEDDEWDEQIKRDVEAGRFDKIIEEIRRDAAEGRLLDFP